MANRQRKSVVLVVDESSKAARWSSALSAQGIRAYQARSMDETLQIASAAPTTHAVIVEAAAAEGEDYSAVLSCPVILVLAQGSAIPVPVNAASGPTDYLIEPFSEAELVNRVLFQLNRHAGPRATLLLSGGVANLRRMTFTRAGADVRLTPTEVALLEYFASHPQRAIDRDELLRHVWGYRRGVMSRAVDHTIKRLRVKIERDAKDPRNILTIHGVGYRFEPTMDGESSEAQEPLEQIPSSAGDAALPPTNLGADPDRFVGRTAEVERLRELLSEHSLVTIVGMGGMGKTRISHRIARERIENNGPSGGVWFFDASEARSTLDVLEVVGDVLQVPLVGAPTSDQLIAMLGRSIAGLGDTLIILDNAEQVVADIAEVLVSWRSSAPRARFLVTSRERLNIAGECVFKLEPMSVEEGAELFIDRSRLLQPSLAFTPEEEALIALIVEGVDRMPLAIELAAGRGHLMPLEQIQEGLAHQRRLLRSTQRDKRQRHRSMWDVVHWSWDLLDDWERDTLIQCAVFRGGFTLEAAEAVVDLEGYPDAPWVIDSISTLCDKSLLTSSPTSRTPRFSMFENIRQFVLEQPAIQEELCASRRHAEHYVKFGDPLFLEALRRTGGVTLRGELVLERKNLVQAMEFALANQEGALGLALCLALMEILNFQGPVSAAVDWSARALAPEGLDPDLRARVMSVRGIALRLAGQLEESERVTREMLEMTRRERLRGQESVAIGSLGVIALELDQREEASQYLEEAMAIAEELGDERNQARWLSNMSVLYRRAGKIDEAMGCYDRALVLCRKLGLRQNEGFLLSELGNLDRQLGRLDNAKAQLEGALAIHREVGDRHHEAIAQNDLGILSIASRRYEEARPHLEAARILAVQIGNRKIEGISCGNLGHLLLETGQLDEARTAFSSAVEIAREVGNRGPAAGFLACIGEVERREGRVQNAHRLLDESESDLRALVYPGAMVEFLGFRARAHLDSGSVDAASEVMVEMRTIVDELGPARGERFTPAIEALQAAIAKAMSQD